MFNSLNSYRLVKGNVSEGEFTNLSFKVSIPKVLNPLIPLSCLL